MARKPSGTKPSLTIVGEHGKPGHNSGATAQELSEDQQQALFHQHMRKIRELKKKMSSINGDIRQAFKVAKAEGVTKKDLDFAFALEKDEDDGMVNARRRETMIAKWLNHALGTQGDLFDDMRDKRPLKERAYDEGKTDGMKSEGPLSPPGNYSPGSDGYVGYVEGWHAGQAAITNIKKKEPEEAPLLRPEGGDPQGADAFDNAADGAPWSDDVKTAKGDEAAAAEAEPAEAL